MKRTEEYDVAISGAGPAGSAAGYWLAKQGYRVLLVEKHSFPRQKACGDGLTPESLKYLIEIGLKEQLDRYCSVDGLRLKVDLKGYRDCIYNGEHSINYGLIISRSELDHLICLKAIQQGANLWDQAIVTDIVWSENKVIGLEVLKGGKKVEVLSKYVIAADGGNSLLARKAGLHSNDPWSVGHALRGYYKNTSKLENKFVVHLPLADSGTNRLVAGYGWVFPVDSNTANIGVGFYPSQAADFDVNIRLLFEKFIQHLIQTDSRFSHIELQGRLLGAPLNCNFNPDKCVGNGIVLIGDAAGLVDPFTGEGISSALKSGKIAAHVIGDILKASPQSEKKLSVYGDLLKKEFRETYQIAKRFIKNYGFMWKLLEDTVTSERMFFKSFHRAVIDYDLKQDRYSNLVPANILLADKSLEEDLNEVRRQLIESLGDRFPLIQKITFNLLALPDSFLRPALLLLCSRFGVNNPRKKHKAAAALEMAYLAFTAHRDILEDQTGKINWGNRFSVLTGDYYLIRAYRQLAEIGSRVTAISSQACADACIGYINERKYLFDFEITEAIYLEIIENKNVSFYKHACILGATLCNVQNAVKDSLTGFGVKLGFAYALTHDVWKFFSDPENENSITKALNEGVYSLPIIHTLGTSAESGLLRILLSKNDNTPKHRQEITDILIYNGSFEYTLDKALNFLDEAKQYLRSLPQSILIDEMNRIADGIIYGEINVIMSKLKNKKNSKQVQMGSSF